MRKIPEERRSHLHRVKSLKSRRKAKVLNILHFDVI